MKHIFIIPLFIAKMACAQSDLVTDSSPSKRLRLTLGTEVFFGPTASLSYGQYIKYQKSFGEATFPETEIGTKIKPLYSGTIGLQGAIAIEENPENILSKFKLLIGLQYFQRGFSSRYTSVYEPSDMDMKDKLKYIETYRLNYASIPISVRYEGQWFAEMGLSHDIFLFATRKEKLKREITGTDAFEGGLKEKETANHSFSTRLFRNRMTGINIAGGKWFSENVGFRMVAHFNRKTLARTNDFKSCTFQAQLIFKL